MLRLLLLWATLIALPGAAQAAADGGAQARATATTRAQISDALQWLNNYPNGRRHQQDLLKVIDAVYFSAAERDLIIQIIVTLATIAQKKKRPIPCFSTQEGDTASIIEEIRLPYVKRSRKNNAQRKEVIFKTTSKLTFERSDFAALESQLDGSSPKRRRTTSSPLPHPSATASAGMTVSDLCGQHLNVDVDPLDAMAAIVADQSTSAEQREPLPTLAPALPSAESYLPAGSYIFVPVPVPAPAPAPGQALPPSHPWFQTQSNPSESSAAWPDDSHPWYAPFGRSLLPKY